MGQVALTPNPATPAIPQPVADLGALAMVSQALKQRVENVSAYVLGLTTAEASTTSDTAAVSSYTLPIASINVLGGVKVDGDNTTVVDGVLQVAGARPATVLPLRDGIAAVGAATSYARADHVHPTDISRYATSNPAGFTTQTYVDAALARISAGATLPLRDGTAAIGVATSYARADHVHPTDLTATALAALNLSTLPTSDPGGGKVWLDGIHLAVGSLVTSALLEDASGHWLLEDASGAWEFA